MKLDILPTYRYTALLREGRPSCVPTAMIVVVDGVSPFRAGPESNPEVLHSEHLSGELTLSSATCLNYLACKVSGPPK